MNKPKVLFVFDHKYEDNWKDGLWAALEVLGEEFEITKTNIAFYYPSEVEIHSHYDFILGWGGFNSGVDQLLQKHYWHGKYGLCIAGNAFPPTGGLSYDVLFYETAWYRPEISFHPNIHQAFGTNTDLYCPIDIPTPVVWDYLGVGAFASWKRWEKMVQKTGRRLVVGEYQSDNERESATIALGLLQSGVMVSPMVNPFDLVNLYHWSRTLYMPADINGGGERAILEARSCGLRVEIEDDNPKLQELLTCDIPSHHDYASALRKGILSCL